jgi:hypothetical protein
MSVFAPTGCKYPSQSHLDFLGPPVKSGKESAPVLITLEQITTELNELHTFELTNDHLPLINGFINSLPYRVEAIMAPNVLKVFHKLFEWFDWEDKPLKTTLINAYVKFFKNHAFPVELHVSAIVFCQRVMKEKCHCDLAIAIPWIASHPQISEHGQTILWNLLVKAFAAGQPDPVVVDCINQTHAHYLRSHAIDFVIAKATSGDSASRAYAVRLFPNSAVDPKIPKYLKVMVLIILDPSEEACRRSSAAKKLCDLLLNFDRPIELNKNMTEVLNQIKRFFLHGSIEIQILMQPFLFSRLWTSNPPQIVKDLYKELLNFEKLPLERKELLASAIPVRKESSNHDLENFLYSLLQTASHDLKKVIVKHIIFSASHTGFGHYGDFMKIFAEQILNKTTNYCSGNSALLEAARAASDLEIVSFNEGRSFYPHVKTVSNPMPPAANKREEEKYPVPVVKPATKQASQPLQKLPGGGLYDPDSGEVVLGYQNSSSWDRPSASTPLKQVESGMHKARLQPMSEYPEEEKKQPVRSKNQRTLMEKQGASLEQARQARIVTVNSTVTVEDEPPEFHLD